MKWLGKYLKQMLGNVKTALSNMRRKVFSTGMTDADIEASEMTLENQQLLNEQEYQRKIDFYEMYESPQAQVRQIKNAGLNPALMYGSAPSVSASGGIGSAGSAAASASASESMGSMLSSLLNMALQSKQLSLQDKWKQREMDIQEDLGNKQIGVQADWNNMNRPKIEADTASIIELTRGSKLDNDLKDKIMPILREKAKADLDYRYQEIAESKKRIDDMDSQIESRRHQNKHFDAMVAQLYSLVSQQDYYTDVYLPQMLSNSSALTSAQVSELNEKANESIERQNQIKQLTREAAASADVREKDVEYYLWNHTHSRSDHGPFGFGQSKEYSAPSNSDAQSPRYPLIDF